MFSFRNSPTKDKILWLTNPDHVTQAILIFVPLWFGVTLLHGTSTFASSPTYRYMQMQMTEIQWAGFSICAAIIGVFCWATQNRHAMIFQNAMLMGWHGLVALCVFIANPVSTGAGTYAVLAFAATVRAINLSLMQSQK